MFELPPLRVDPATLPPAILTSEIGSFAHETLRSRVPIILQETITLNRGSATCCAALEELYAELTAGVVRGLREEAPDRPFWDAATAAHVGRSWLDLPWFWAETFFYRRVLEATGYFQPGPGQGRDPYAAKKRTEWVPEAAPRAVDDLLCCLPADPHARFTALLHASLWGNRTDLSYMVAAHLGGTANAADERQNLLADDTEAVWEFLRAGGAAQSSRDRRSRGPGVPRLAVIADNAGTELLMDLALVNGLLADGLAREITLHVKPQPFFVSDTLIQDVADGLDALALGSEVARGLAERIRGHLAAGRLRLTTHWFYASSLHYFQAPADLCAELARQSVVLLKGDANYRRLLGDAHWPHTTPFTYVTRYFPAPLVALRTLKAEQQVGLQPGQAERLTAEDPAWLVNGRRGVIQARLLA